MPPKNTLLGMTTAEPVSTGVHSNINNLLAQSDKTHLWQKALGEIEKGMSNYKHPDPITGTAPDIALSPLLAAKKIPSMMKLLKKIKNFRNPIYHHTSIPNALRILETKKIKPTSPFKHESEIVNDFHWDKLKAISITRDPSFLARPHSNIGTDIRFIMDRDELVRQGYRLKPYVEKGFPKVNRTWNTKEYIRMNPRFEFEERILGSLPTKDIKLMDWAKIPINYGTFKPPIGKGLLGERRPSPYLQNLIDTVVDMDQKSTKLPIIMNEQVRSTLKKVQPYLMDRYNKNNPDRVKALEKLMAAPTYKYNPFRTPKIKVWDEKLQKAVMIDNPK